MSTRTPPAPPSSQPSAALPAALGGLVLLASCLALPLAFRATGFHVVPASDGTWRGLTDPPAASAWLQAGAAGLLLAWALRRRPVSVWRPLLWLGLAAAPLLPVLTGHGLLLLLFQGPALIVLAAGALGVSLARDAAGARALGRAREPVLFAAALAFYALLGARLPGPAGPQGDEPHYLAAAHSLLTDGDLDLADEFRNREYRGFFAGTLEAHASPASPEGKLYSVHAPGLPALLLPAYALGGAGGARLLVSAMAALAGVLVFRLVRASSGHDALALAAWAAFALTPPLPFYALSIYPETPAALATAMFLIASRRDPGWGALLAATLAAAALPWLHPKFLPLAALGLGLTLARRVSWPARAAAVSAVFASLCALVAFFHALYGRASLSAAYGPGFASDVSLARAPWGAAALLLDRQFGLLAVGPLWALAVPGAWALARSRFGDLLRALLLGAAGAGVGASFSMWWGGACPPARFVVPALPALALALAPALASRRGVAAGLGGAGLAIVALAAEAPRALHNRADGASGLLRFLAPGLDLDAGLPSFVLGGPTPPLLALTLCAALALAWRWGARGLLAGALAYSAVAGGLRERPLLDARQATLRLLAAWDETNVAGVSGPLALPALSVPLELWEPSADKRTRGGPVVVAERELAVSGRLDLPPGLYTVSVLGSAWQVPPRSRTARLDLSADEVLLERMYFEEGQQRLAFPLLLPAGVRRLALTVVGVQGRTRIQRVAFAPEALVPRRMRRAHAWPRQADPGLYRVASGLLRASGLEGATSVAGGFGVEREASLLVEAPAGATVRLGLSRRRPSAEDRLSWAGRPVELGAAPEQVLLLPADAGVRLGSTVVVPLELRSAGARLAFDPPRP